MQTEQIVALLIQERDKLNRAIEVLQSGTKKSGPTKPEGVEGGGITPQNKPRKKRTAAQRKIQAEKMKLYWKKKKAAK